MLVFSLLFGVWRLALGVWRLAFGVWRSAVELLFIPYCIKIW